VSEDVLKTFIVFGFIAAIVLGSQYLNMRRRARVHETIEMAMKQGQPLPPELVDLITNRDPDSQKPSDLRWGLIAFSTGVGLAIFGQVMGAVETEARTVFTGFAAIPGCIGIAGVLLHFLGRKSL
jgi:hypothetical protein